MKIIIDYYSLAYSYNYTNKTQFKIDNKFIFLRKLRQRTGDYGISGMTGAKHLAL